MSKQNNSNNIENLNKNVGTCINMTEQTMEKTLNAIKAKHY